MFVVLQHPFADLRGFVGVGSARLSRPTWPIVNAQADFVRSAGLVRTRPRGGVKEWAGEEIFCEAAAALRFANFLGRTELGSDVLKAQPRRTIRRFQSEGTVARLEVGLRLAVTAYDHSHSGNDVLRLLRDCAQLPIRVPRIQPLPMPLVQAGSVLARHFLLATTKRKLNPAVAPQPWWFSSGSPAILVESDPSRPLELPPHSRRVLEPAATGAAVAHCWLQFAAQRCSAWFVEAHTTDDDTIRRLRIHLLRLHAERECLRQVLSRVNDGSLDLAGDTARSDAVQQYLNDTLQVIERPKRFGQQQGQLLDAAREALGVAFEGQNASFQKMRRQIAVKVDGYIRRAQRTTAVTNVILGDQMNTSIQLGNVTVTGGDFNLVTAKSIQGSFNKAANADVSAELKEKLQALTVEVAKLAKELPAEEAEKAARDLEALTDEVTSKNPRKKWYELSAEGLIDAAKAVGEIAAPVVTAVKAVLALLVV